MILGIGIGLPFGKIKGLGKVVKALIFTEDIKLSFLIEKMTTKKTTAIGLGYNFEL